jgi:AraC family transcriptional regulator, regulatory protein of adaptative response / DNA-3-methyladenine glycosylase II
MDLSLAYDEPVDAPALLDHFARRAVPGIERIDGTRYTRSLSLPGGPAVVEMRLDGSCPVHVTLTLGDPADEGAAIARLRALLDLDADPAAVTAALGEDPLLGGLVRAHPGRRVPGAAGAAELAVRAVLGQQISLAGAATAAGRLVSAHGEPLPPGLAGGGVTHLFPTAVALAALDPSQLAMPRTRGRSLVGLSAAFAAGDLVLERGGDPEAARAGLLPLAGIGPWTADYVVMRVLGDHDVFLPTDLGVRRALERAGVSADPRSAADLAARWAPYRSYALQYLWTL